MAMAIVEMKSPFSNPLLVCWIFSEEPPKAAPSAASDRWSKIKTIKTTESPI